MLKKLICIYLALALLCSLVLPVSAAEEKADETQYITILNLKSLEKLARNCRLDSYSRNLVVSLQTDLDLEGRDFDGIPIFCGRFEGNGHTIRGLNFAKDGSAQGFFRYLTDTALVQNLHLEGEIHMEGSAAEIGAVAGQNSGTIRNCSFTGSISGKAFIGGIAGQNMVSGVLENCKVSGSLSGDHFVGGLAGKNAGVVRSCVNEATINESPQENTVELTDITLDSAMQSEAANTVTDLGGIAGNSTGYIRDCKNLANIGHASMGYNIGGIVGTQSGTVQNCENYGNIFGRKEIGGIAGQMEPTAVMNFEEDVLQILSRQLGGMGNIVSEASANLQGSGEAIIGQVGNMYWHVNNAKESLELLLPSVENGERPDDDTLQAARNGLGSSINGMAQTLNGISATASSALGAVTSNLQAMNNQINAMRNTISNADETLGGSIVDKSDEDTDADITGKVFDCRNFGDVHADLSGGGITGAMAMENDADVEEDIVVTGNESLNFESEIRAVVLNCENDAVVTVGKQYAGGIVGLQSLGLVKNSRNFGKLDASNADYVGGISGSSLGFIRSSHANGELFGKTYVGGIAGSATIATDCYALVNIHDSLEKSGAVLGFLEEDTKEEENPFAGNYYLPVPYDIGAVDGISYADKAQPIDEEAFFRLEGIPDRFSKVIVTFLYDGGKTKEFTLRLGETFPENRIPLITPKDGQATYWEGLAEILKNGQFFDTVVEQVYKTAATILESPATRGELPLLFVQGVFSESAELTVQSLEHPVGLPEDGKLLEAWSFQTTEPENQNQLRLQLPESADPEKISILVLSGDGIWRTEPHSQFGRYAVVALNPHDNGVAVVHQESEPWMILVTVFAGIAVLAGAVYVGKAKKKKG